MTQAAESAVAGTALLLCKDAQTRRLIVESLRALAIDAEGCEDLFAALGLLEKRKFEAVFVDLLLRDEAALLMEQLRFSPTNRTAVTFAVTAGTMSEIPGAGPRSTFVLERPLTAASITQTLRAAYGLIVRERRRYFRCPVEVPAFVRSQQTEELLCQTVNISEGGIAITAPCTLELAGPAAVRFSLPGHDVQFFADTTVCWREGGLVGLEFRFLAPPQKSELQEWLACKLDEVLPESVVALFRTVG